MQSMISRMPSLFKENLKPTVLRRFLPVQVLAKTRQHEAAGCMHASFPRVPQTGRDIARA